MQVNRLSTGLQEQLKTASNFNTARSETLFDKTKFAVNDDNEIDFGSLDIDDLNISQDQIAGLLGNFTDEIIKAFSGKLPDMSQDNPFRVNDPFNSEQKNSFTA